MEEDIGLVKAPRICEMIREESGYGFNLHGEKGVIGQYISAIDTGGAADKSGLCVGDRVVEVNGINVEAMSHSEVVHYIRSDPEKAILLVVDKITDNYLKNIKRPVTSSLASYSSVRELIIQETEKLNDLNLTKDVNISTEEASLQNKSSLEEHSPSPPPALNTSPPPSAHEPVHEPSTQSARDPSPPPARDSSPLPAREPSPPIVSEISPSPNTHGDKNSLSNGSPDPGESKKEALMKIMGKQPKRKEVKEKKTDWSTKLSEFNKM